MALLEGEVPERRWELSAPESGVLLWGPETKDAEALKLALLELVVRRALRLVAVKERRLIWFTRRTDVLVSGPLANSPASRTLRPVAAVSPRLRNYPDGIVGAPVAEWARAAFERFRGSGGYVQAEILPALRDRGLFTREDYRRLGLFGATRWVLTTDGTAALTDLRAMMGTGRVLLGEWMIHDPARAEAFVERAAAALLLLPERFPEFRRRRQPDSGTGVDGGAVVVFIGDGEGRPEDGGRPDDQAHGDPTADIFDLDALGDVFGPGAFDGIDAAFDAIDAGVDSGDGDGGGDGE